MRVTRVEGRMKRDKGIGEGRPTSTRVPEVEGSDLDLDLEMSAGEDKVTPS